MHKTATKVAEPAGHDLHDGHDDQTPGPDVVVYYGYLSQAASAGGHRLSEEPRSDDYIEIQARDIVDRFPADGEGHPAGRVAIWVRRDADVMWCQKVKASSFDVSGRRWPRG